MFFAHHSLNEEVITEAADVGAVESLHLISELLVSFPMRVLTSVIFESLRTRCSVIFFLAYLSAR